MVLDALPFVAVGFDRTLSRHRTTREFFTEHTHCYPHSLRRTLVHQQKLQGLEAQAG